MGVVRHGRDLDFGRLEVERGVGTLAGAGNCCRVDGLIAGTAVFHVVCHANLRLELERSGCLVVEGPGSRGVGEGPNPAFGMRARLTGTLPARHAAQLTRSLMTVLDDKPAQLFHSHSVPLLFPS